MSTDFEPEGSSKERNLAADRGDRFSGAARKPAAAARDRRCRLAKITAASVLAHGCLVLAFVLPDEARNPPGAAREIPVEVVTEPALLETRPVAPGEATQARSREPRQMPETEANPKPANDAMSGPNPVAKPAAPQPAATHEAGARAKPARHDVADKEITHEPLPAARLAGGPRQNENAGSEHRRPMQTGLAQPFDSGPDRFRAAAMPVAAKSGGEAVSYRFLVGGMLERVKHYPEAARQRGAKGIATIGFVLDVAGRIRSVSLLRSSGEADLDAESVALVNRAAPFPPPPPGAQHSFAIEVAFGMGA
ncbi:MAG: energy transducer TonB [Pseudomonadota bacterium]|nr:energy transducer TonB [Pseudomonadota bacterium]